MKIPQKSSYNQRMLPMFLSLLRNFKSKPKRLWRKDSILLSLVVTTL